MESFTGELLLALSPPLRQPRPCTPVWLCYQLRSGPRLWRCAPASSIRGGVLMAEDSALGSGLGDWSICVSQALRECAARGARGFWANWDRPPEAAMTDFTAALEEALGQAGVTLYVNEPYAGCTRRARVLLSSALSGGTLEGRLRDGLKQYGRERLVLAVERMGEDFTLPAPDGQGQPLGYTRAAEQARRRGAAVHRSGELCASYFTYTQGGQTHLVLFDTDDDVRAKLRLAQRLGLERVLLARNELGGLR